MRRIIKNIKFANIYILFFIQIIYIIINIDSLELSNVMLSILLSN